MSSNTTGRTPWSRDANEPDLRVRTGIDVQAISRFREFDPAVAAGIKERAFTDDERAYCERMQDPPQHYAVRWAAKEAFVKLLAGDRSVPFECIGVNRDSPRPALDLSRRARDALVDAFRSAPPDVDDGSALADRRPAADADRRPAANENGSTAADVDRRSAADWNVAADVDRRPVPDVDVSLSHDRDADVAMAQIVAFAEVTDG